MEFLKIRYSRQPTKTDILYYVDVGIFETYRVKHRTYTRLLFNTKFNTKVYDTEEIMTNIHRLAKEHNTEKIIFDTKGKFANNLLQLFGADVVNTYNNRRIETKTITH